MDAETQTQAQTSAPRLKTNLDTNFLKLIAILCMVVDHVGTVFFPGYPAFRWVGRLAFPIFCYCLTVGLMYTHGRFWVCDQETNSRPALAGRLWNCIFSNVMVGSGEKR